MTDNGHLISFRTLLRMFRTTFYWFIGEAVASIAEIYTDCCWVVLRRGVFFFLDLGKRQFAFLHVVRIGLSFTLDSLSEVIFELVTGQDFMNVLSLKETRF